MAKKPAAKAAQKPHAPTYPVNAALEAAVIASAEDDTPRLVYADWLDENGDPDRAAFIRTQVALWDKHPADADYVDLLERQEELDLLGVAERLKPQLPRELEFRGYASVLFARGFPFFAAEREPPASRGRAGAVRLRGKLPVLFRNTTIRGLQCGGSGAGGHLDVLLDSPESHKLAALCVPNYDSRTDPPVSAVQSILNSPATNLQWLAVDDVHSDVAELVAGVKSVTSLKRFSGSFIYCTDELKDLFASAWFRGLHRVDVRSAEWAAKGMVMGLARLPELHTIEATFHSEALEVSPDIGPFRSLGRLCLEHATLREGGETALARARMPRLSVLELTRCEMGDREVVALARSPLFANLRVLALDDPIGDGAITAIAESASAAQLRYLNLQNSVGDGTFGQWFRRLATSFPNLTTLLVGPRQGSVSAREVARFFAEMSAPVRSLSLPFALSDGAASKLANNAAFGQLRTLTMSGTNGEQPLTLTGLQTLLKAKNLSNLTYLAVGGAGLQKVLPLLRDPSALPDLRELRIGVSVRVGDKIEWPRPGLTVRCLAGT
jgi:uncharacterized protein (TIGR02996 family)